MRGRGVVVVTLLLVLGLAGGYAGSLALAGEPEPSGVAEPVVARKPSIPVDPVTQPAPDPDGPALRPGILLTEETMDGGRFQIIHPVPVGWRANRKAADETKWKKPGTVNNTYVLRIAQVTSEEKTVEDLMDERVASLAAEQDEFVPVTRGAGSLEYTYLSDEGTARHSFIRCLDLDADGLADVEIVVHGRKRDVRGTRDLVERIAAGTRAG